MDERKKSERRMARVPRREGLHLLPEPTKSPTIRPVSAVATFSILVNVILLALLSFLGAKGTETSKALGSQLEAVTSENKTLAEDLDTARASWGHSLKENKKLQQQMAHIHELLKKDRPWDALHQMDYPEGMERE